MIPYESIAELVFNRPHFVTPRALDAVGAYVLGRMRSAGGYESGAGERPIESFQAFPAVAKPDGSVEVHSPRSSRFVGEYAYDETTGRPTPYRITSDGIAVITVVGKLVNRGAWLGASSGLVSYEGLKHQLAMVTKDARVKQTILDLQSPGGEAVGCFDCAAAVRRAAAAKPIVAFVNGMACSAAYALASAATRIVCIPEGETGSIGVVMMHVDFSVALQMEGIKPTFIFAGAHKVDGNPYEALPKEVRVAFQAEIDALYEMFVTNVSTYRPALTPDAIRSTEAQVYRGAEALSLGLIDAVGTFEDLLIEMAAPAPVTVVIGDADDGGDEDESGAAGARATEDKNMKLSEVKESLKKLGAWAIGGDATLEDAGGAPAQSAASAAIPAADVHHFTPGGDAKALCGAPIGGVGISGGVNLADVNCDNCLRAELARRDADAKKREDEAAAAAETERQARIDAEVATFKAKCANAGAEATAALCEEFAAAKNAGDDARVARLEKIVAAYQPPGMVERLPENGPSAEEVAAHAKDGGADVGAEAAKRLKARGVKPSSKQWTAEYAAEVAKIRTERGMISAAA